MPKIHINEDAYSKLKDMAGEQNRSVANMAETIFYNVWGKQPSDAEERLKYPIEELKLAKINTTIPLSFVSKSGRECKNGHPIPAGRERCLGKGCKYS